MRLKWLVFVGLLCLLIACQNGGVEVENVWAPSLPAAANNGVFYLTIRNSGREDDTLVQAESAACGATELHETYAQENGSMGMRHLPDGVPIPAKKEVIFDTGGFHIMCIDKLEDFSTAKYIELHLTFAKAGVLAVEAEIRE